MNYERKNKPNAKVRFLKEKTRTNQRSDSKELATCIFSMGQEEEAEVQGSKLTIKLIGFVELFTFDSEDVEIIETLN